MNHSLAIALVCDDVYFVGVRFRQNDGKESREYTYKTMDKTLKVGDAVVVPGSESSVYGIAFVSTLDADVNYNDSITYKWIVQKVNPTNYNAVIKEEQRIVDELKVVERKKRRENLRRALMEEGADEFKALSQFNPAIVQEQEGIDNGGEIIEPAPNSDE